MQILAGEQILELYAHNNVNMEWKRRYDCAAVAFLRCVAETGEYLSSIGRKHIMPFR